MIRWIYLTLNMNWHDIKKTLQETGMAKIDSKASHLSIIDISTFSKANEGDLKTLQSNAGYIWIDQWHQLEQFTVELNPLVYDLVELSEREMIPEIPVQKKISQHFLQSNTYARFKICDDPTWKRMVQEYKGVIFVQQAEEELGETSIVRLEANGLVKIIRA